MKICTLGSGTGDDTAVLGGDTAVLGGDTATLGGDTATLGASEREKEAGEEGVVDMTNY